MWLRVMGEGLEGRRLVVEGNGIHSTAYRLGGADPARDGLWIPLKRKPDRMPELEFHPTVNDTPETMIISTPGGLSANWVVVPLPLSAWGVESIGELESVRLSGRRGRVRAGSVVRRSDRSAVCPGPKPAAVSFALPLVVADFESGIDEPLGNRHGAFQGRGASVVAERVRSSDGAILRISADFPKGEGFGGVWFHLAPPELLEDPERGVDLRGAHAIVVRGRGDARGAIGISDVAASKRDESVRIGTLRAEENGSWTVLLPIDRDKLDLSRLRSVVINLTGTGSGSVDIDEILIVEDDDQIPHARRLSAPEDSPPPKAGTWVWNTKDLFDPASSLRARLEKAVRIWGLTEIYLQIPHDGEAVTAEQWGKVEHAEELASLVGWIHGLGAEVHALDGAPYFALPEAHAELMAIASGVGEYNRNAPPEGRFDGLHMDIEPYLLPAWSGPRRPEVLHHLGASIRKMREQSGLPVWLDIPFWLDSEREERSPERGEGAGCAKRRFLETAFREADGIGIMAYRTRADGDGGIAGVAVTEARMAKERQRPLRIGVETIDLPPESGWFLRPGDGGAAIREGGPLALIPRSGPAAGRFLLFVEAATNRDLVWVRSHGDEYQMFPLEFEEGVSPSRITFWGRSGEEVRKEAEEAIRLLRGIGLRADGIAYHELRTLP